MSLERFIPFIKKMKIVLRIRKRGNNRDEIVSLLKPLGKKSNPPPSNCAIMKTIPTMIIQIFGVDVSTHLHT